MLAALAGRPLDPNQSGNGRNRYNETMLVRNPHLRMAVGVLMALALCVRAGTPGVTAGLGGAGVMSVEVCTREGLTRVPVDERAPGEHGTGIGCHLMACTVLAHGAGLSAGDGALPAAVYLSGVAVAPVAQRGASGLLPVLLRARGPPLVLASLKGASLPYRA